MKRVRRLLGMPLAALLIGGCWLDLDPWHHAGHATLQWSVDGRRDANACARRAADRVEIRTFDWWGRTDTLSTAPCSAFEETILLDPGWYHADLTLLDTSGRAISSTLGTESFRVEHHRSTFVAPVDL